MLRSSSAAVRKCIPLLEPDGMRVACRSNATGENHPDWKLINFVERSTDGEWIPVTGDGYQHGFVDIGLNQGSTPSSISMYGSW